jgi:hypothetical protein
VKALIAANGFLEVQLAELREDLDGLRARAAHAIAPTQV